MRAVGPSPVARRRRLPSGTVAPGVVSVALGLLLWQALVSTRSVTPDILPAPWAVAREWWTLAADGVLWGHVSVTLSEALLGFALAFVVGVVLGYPLARSRLLSGAITPYVTAAQAMPVIALAPLIVMWFGLGLSAKVLICALIVFFPILVNTAVGLLLVEREMIEAAQNMGANRWQILRYVEAPLALRSLLGGVRVGITLAMTGAIVGEFVSSEAGLGYLMTYGRSIYDSAMVLAAALTMVGVALVGYLVVGLLERLLITWE